MASVELNQLSKTFPGGVRAVRDVDLRIDDGEFVVLVGPSGCGKSTTLRMIAGLEEITSGEVRIGGRVVNDVAPADRDVAMVFQNYALYPHMSVHQNMAFGLKMRRTPKREIERRVAEAAKVLSIEELLKRRPRELSGGQRQRVALGRAIVRDPQVFLFDEPLSNLDAKLRVQMRTEIALLHGRLAATMIYVTHDQSEAMTLADRIVLMDGGVVQQVATPLEIYNRPANRFVATFIGSPAMNLVPGNVHGGQFRLAETGSTNGVVPLEVASKIPNGAALLGVRPEDLLTDDSGLPLATVGLEAVEHLGHETMAHFDLAGERHVARLPAGSTVARGDQLSLSLRRGAFHLFAADETGHRLN
jgi:ABC-type sugar transport system ATPase subunit